MMAIVYMTFDTYMMLRGQHLILKRHLEWFSLLSQSLSHYTKYHWALLC